MYDFDASSRDGDEFGRYVSDMSGNSVTVCNKTYTCRSLSKGNFWTSDPKHDTEPESRECRLDVLAAAGFANNCDVRKTIQSTPPACTDKRPFLEGSNGKVVQLRGNENSNEMPTLLEGGWRCMIPSQVTTKTHRPRHMERVGGLTFVHMEARKDVVEEKKPAKEETEAPPPPPPPAQASESSVEEAPPPPPVPSPPTTTDPPPPSKPFLAQPTPAPPPATNTVAPPPSSDESSDAGGWTRCPVPPPKVQAAACSIDQDCPLTPEQYKEILWSHVKDSAQTNFPALLKHIRENVSSVITWTDDASTRKRLTTKTQMKNALMNMFDTDATFRATVTEAVDGDAEFAERRNALVGGSCTAKGKCKIATVTPQTKIFDGKSNDVVFTILDDDTTVTYATPSGLSREVQAVKCTPSTQELCDRATEVDGAALRAGITPVSSTYRIRAPDTMSEFVVMNNISARDASRCDARLCELNQNSCPASSCMLDEEKRCVPKL